MGQLIPPSSKGNLFILSGPREIGKTSFLISLLKQTSLLNLSTAGLISPAVFENGKKTAIDLLDLQSGITRRLAYRRKEKDEGVLTGHWTFDPEVLNWGNQVLGKSCPCDLLVVDELGPIELERGQGWQNGILALSSGNYKAAVAVIRPELIEKACQLWPQGRMLLIHQNPDPELLLKQNMILMALSLT